MKKVNFIFSLIIIGGICFFFFFKILLIRIELGEVGVRLNQYGVLGEKGVEKEDYAAGWHRSLPVLDTWEIFDATVQTTEFTTAQERQRTASWRDMIYRSGGQTPSNTPITGPERIELKSVDGYTVEFDVTIKYRIQEGMAYKLYQQIGSEAGYKGLVRDLTQGILRDVLGTMKTEDFYNPEIRREKILTAQTLLREDLQGIYVELVDVLIRDISFSEAYERKIRDKKLADQDVELNKSRAILEEKRGETNRIEAEAKAMVAVIDQEIQAELVKMKAETERQIAKIDAEAKFQVAQLEADADRYAAEKIAIGELLEKEAEAEGERLKAQALQSSGGRNLVAREMIRGLNLREMTISTIQTDFLDVEAMISRFGAGE